MSDTTKYEYTVDKRNYVINVVKEGQQYKVHLFVNGRPTFKGIVTTIFDISPDLVCDYVIDNFLAFEYDSYPIHEIDITSALQDILKEKKTPFTPELTEFVNRFHALQAQNEELVKKNEELVKQNAELLKQNTDLLKQTEKNGKEDKHKDKSERHSKHTALSVDNTKYNKIVNNIDRTINHVNWLENSCKYEMYDIVKEARDGLRDASTALRKLADLPSRVETFGDSFNEF